MNVMSVMQHYYEENHALRDVIRKQDEYIAFITKAGIMMAIHNTDSPADIQKGEDLRKAIRDLKMKANVSG